MCDVVIATGEVFHIAIDLDVDGFPAFQFRRRYSSTSRASSPIGLGWEHNWDVSLRRSADALTILDGHTAHTVHPLASCDGTTGPRVQVDGDRHAMALVYPDGRRLVFVARAETAGEWRLAERVDAHGNSTRLAYRDGRLTEIADSSGRRVTLQYRGSLLSTLTLLHRQSQQVVRFQHDSRGRLLETINPLGHVEQFAYDEHLLVRHVDETGAVRRFCYDERQRCILNWYQDDLKIRRLDFAGDDTMVVLCDSYGYRDVYRLEQGRIVSLTDALGRRTEWIYDADGALMCRLLPDGKPFEVGVWDQTRQRLRATDARGAQTEYFYDRDRRRTVISNAIQSVEIEQDARGDVVAVKNSDGAEWRFAYDERGSLQRFVNPLGEWIHREEREGEVRAWDADGLLGVFTFDALGNLVRHVDALGRTTTCEYAGQNLLTAMRRADGSTIRWTYDARGRITAVVDGLGRETRYEYSAFGSVVRTVYPDGSDERLVLDRDENLRAIVNSKGESCTLEPDAAFRERRIVLFDGRTLGQEFDARNQAVALTDARGGTMHIEYDGANTPVRLTFADGTVRTYALNDSAMITDIQQFASAVTESPARTASFAYNASNYVIGETHDAYEVHYEHDLANNLTAIRDSLGRDIRYTLGPWGAVIGIQDGPHTYGLRYSREGELVGLTLPNGMQQRFEFDACSRLVRREVLRADGAVVAWRRFVYDAADQLIEMDDWRLGLRRFEHDRRGRLVRVLDPTGATLEQYVFDSEGNLLASPRYPTSRLAPGNRLVAADDVTFEYDEDGNLVRMRDAAAEWTYAHDPMDQLARVSRDGEVAAVYEYDLIGRRTTTTTPTDQIRYHYHVNTLAQMTSTRHGQWHFLFVPFTFVPLAQWSERGAYFYSWDQVGVPTEIWREDGTLVAVVTASAFGDQRLVEYLTEDRPPVPFHFMGQIVDDDTGLHYNRYRYYQPRTARYTTQDPFGLAAGLNLYPYPTNPLNVVDPLGLTGLTLEISCVPSKPPPFTPCEQAAMQKKIEIMNANLQQQGRKARCTSCRDNEQKDYFINTCGGKVPKGWQVDHIQELQVGGGDLCCENLMAIPQRPNGSCGSQIYHQIKDYGGTIVGAVIKAPGCKQAHKCKSDGTKRGNPPPGKECEHPNPVC